MAEQQSPLESIKTYLRLEPTWFRRGLTAGLVITVAVLFLLAAFVKSVSTTAGLAVANTAIILLLGLLVDRVVLALSTSQLEITRGEAEAIERQERFVTDRSPAKIRMCEYSAQSVGRILEAAVNAHSVRSLQLLLCHPGCVLPGYQRNSRLRPAIERLQHVFPLEAVERMGVEIRCYETPGSLRGRNYNDELIVTGWYTHDRRVERTSDARQIWGHSNPLVVAPVGLPEGQILRGMFNEVFDNLWRDSPSLKAALESCDESQRPRLDNAWLDAVSRDRQASVPGSH